MAGYVSAIIFLCIWCILSGQGGLVRQADDWTKHNAILHDLVHYKWPVRYEYQGMEGVLSYYIGEYIFPAAIGKILGHSIQVTELVLFF